MFLQPVRRSSTKPPSTTVYQVGDANGPFSDGALYQSFSLALIVGFYEPSVLGTHIYKGKAGLLLTRESTYTYRPAMVSEVEIVTYSPYIAARQRVSLLAVIAQELEDSKILPNHLVDFPRYAKLWVKKCLAGDPLNIELMTQVSQELSVRVNGTYPDYRGGLDLHPELMGIALSVICAIKSFPLSRDVSGYYTVDALHSFVNIAKLAINDRRILPVSIEQVIVKMAERAVYIEPLVADKSRVGV